MTIRPCLFTSLFMLPPQELVPYLLAELLIDWDTLWYGFSETRHDRRVDPLHIQYANGAN